MLEQTIATLSEHPSVGFALLGVLFLIFFFLHTRNIRFTPSMLTHISLAVALTGLLSMIRIYHFPQGGSVTLGAMLPLILLSFRYGPGIGALGGFLFSILLLARDPFLLHPVQVLFDYPLPMMAMGLAGCFPHRAIFSTVFAFFGRFLCHFISGIVFFASYAPEGTSPVLYSLLVNGSIVSANCLLCCLILKVLPLRRIMRTWN